MKRYIVSGVVILVSVLMLSGRWNVFASNSHQVAFGTFIGSWVGHGRGLQVSHNGYGTEHFRTYVNCNNTQTTNCDMFTHESIYDGGFLSFTLNRVAANKAFGTINNSGYSWLIGTKVTLVRTSHDTITIRALAGYGAFCGPNAPVGYCGA